MLRVKRHHVDVTVVAQQFPSTPWPRSSRAQVVFCLRRGVRAKTSDLFVLRAKICQRLQVNDRLDPHVHRCAPHEKRSRVKLGEVIWEDVRQHFFELRDGPCNFAGVGRIPSMTRSASVHALGRLAETKRLTLLPQA